MDKNICHLFLEETQQDLDIYWLHCDTLADKVEDWASEKGISARAVMIARPDEARISPQICIRNGKQKHLWWVYHVVIEVKGVIHDPWFPTLLPTKEYMQQNFGHYDDLSFWEIN